MLKEILSWDDEAVQFAAPFLRIVMPLLLELKDILNDQVRTRKLKAGSGREGHMPLQVIKKRYIFFSSLACFLVSFSTIGFHLHQSLALYLSLYFD